MSDDEIRVGDYIRVEMVNYISSDIVAEIKGKVFLVEDRKEGNLLPITIDLQSASGMRYFTLADREVSLVWRPEIMMYE